MSSSVDNATRSGAEARRSRRPHDAEASRADLLAAAREVFRERGYERATTRAIGERAGVDPALIARYFESKEGLFLAAVGTMEAADSSAPEPPAAFIGHLLESWEERGHNPVSRALASPALSDDARRLVSELVAELLLSRQSAALRARGVPAPELRAELLVALAVGIGITRANGTLQTLAAASREEVVAALEPLLDVIGPAGG